MRLSSLFSHYLSLLNYSKKCFFVIRGIADPRLIDDERNFLYIHFIRALIKTKASCFIAENVKGYRGT